MNARLVAKVWLLSRVVIALVGVVVMVTGHIDVGTLLRRWDVLHFMAIASDGYADPTSAAFFPGLPMLLKAGTFIGVPMEATGVVAALAGSALAAAALYKMFGAPAACLWLIAPTAVFTAVGYTEAAFCAAAFWAWYHARRNGWWQAAVLAGVACTLRVSGLFLVGALAVLALVGALRGASPNTVIPPEAPDSVILRGAPDSVILRGAKRSRRIWPRLSQLLVAWVWLLVPLAVLGAYEVYLHGVTGSWTAWLQAQQTGWSRGFTNPWDSLKHTIDAGYLARWPGRPDVAWVFRAEVFSMAVGLATTIWCLVRRHWAAAAFVAVQVVAFGTSYWYMSINRAVLLWFPLWAVLGAAVTWRPARWGRAKDVAVAAYVVMSGAAMIIWAWLFFSGRWAS